MSEVAIRIVPATRRAQHQVSCEKVDNLSKFILNHIKMSMTIFPGMNRYKKYLFLKFSKERFRVELSRIEPYLSFRLDVIRLKIDQITTSCIICYV